MSIYENINALTGYALTAGLIKKDDIVYTKNRLLELFKLDGFESSADSKNIPQVQPEDLELILCELTDWAFEHNLFSGNSTVYRDLFDTKIMSCLVPPPSVVREQFYSLYKKSPELATDWYYKFSQDSDYIRRYRIKKDLKWITKTEYGDIDITINLSKPEKDPKAIAEAFNKKNTGYPECLLCLETEGYAGRPDFPARQNHRIIPVELGGTTWGFQYSPYVYYNEHCIVLSSKHTPMIINENMFRSLFDFIKQFPHYTVGSNADLPIVGGSILTHNHFQGGKYTFAMAKAGIETEFSIKGFEDVHAGIIKWPMSVIRLDSENPEHLISLASRILNKWRSYNDRDAFIFSKTDGVLHNTITPIARMNGKAFELDLVLRNNITTEEHPLGVFHPHAELHHIKKENIGLIEVMGLAVLPGRLKKELDALETALVEGMDISKDSELSKHAEWVKEFLPHYDKIDASNVSQIIRNETGKVFVRVLEDSGVFKRTEKGKSAFMRFIKEI